MSGKDGFSGMLGIRVLYSKPISPTVHDQVTSLLLKDTESLDLSVNPWVRAAVMKVTSDLSGWACSCHGPFHCSLRFFQNLEAISLLFLSKEFIYISLTHRYIS